MRTIHLLVLSACLVSCAHTPPQAPQTKRKLLLFLTVDQLRGDMLDLHRKSFSKTGFRRLMNQGLHYTNAHFQHATTLTAPGHATLATGTSPRNHGIIGNDWAEQGTGRKIYCVIHDDERSPENLLAETIGDVLVKSSPGSRVFSVSLKDRGAILPGGQLGKAYWYNRKKGRFTTSDYYHEGKPKWLKSWNRLNSPLQYKDSGWKALGRYSGKKTGRPDHGFFGNPPHRFTKKTNKEFLKSFRFTPMADELTAKFAKDLIRRKKIGRGKTMDMLAISFSATDYVGHLFGPESNHYKDNLLHLDRTIASLLDFIDKEVGLQHTTIVLSADHGASEFPTEIKHRDHSVHRMKANQLSLELGRSIQTKFGLERPPKVSYFNPGIYVDETDINSSLVPAINQHAKEFVTKLGGFAAAYTRKELSGSQPTQGIRSKVWNAFHPERSGNIVTIPVPNWYVDRGSGIAYPGRHGSPYFNDTHVPILFVDASLKKKRIDRKVAPKDIAVTLARFFDLQKPNRADGTPLKEALR